MRYLPLFTDLRGRTVVVSGGGEAAARKLRLLLRADAKPIVFAEAANDEIEALERSGRIRRVRRGGEADDVGGSALVVVADMDTGRAGRIAESARVAGIPVNVVDRADLSTVVMPGIVDRDPILIAIGSAGASPVLVQRLRTQIEALLPSRLGGLARFAQRFRNAVAGALPAGRRRRRFWDTFFDGPIARLVLEGRESAAAAAMLRLVNGAPPAPQAGSVALVGVGPGDPDLLTLRALRVMQAADVVVYDRLIGDGILDYVRRDATRIYVGKASGDHVMTQDAINALLARHARAGRAVVRLKGGDPFIFGRGGEEMTYLRDAGIGVEIVPGITAAIGCAAAAGLPLTHRDYASGVIFLTAHRCQGAPDLDWAALAASRQTLAIYMGVSTAGITAERLLAHGMAPATPVAVVANGTRSDQVVACGSLATLAETVARHGSGGPALIVIGDVAALALASTPAVGAPTQARARAV